MTYFCKILLSYLYPNNKKRQFSITSTLYLYSVCNLQSTNLVLPAVLCDGLCNLLIPILRMRKLKFKEVQQIAEREERR